MIKRKSQRSRSTEDEVTSDDTNNSEVKIAQANDRKSLKLSWALASSLFLLLPTSLAVLSRLLSTYHFLHIITLIPVGLCFLLAVRPGVPFSRRILPATLVSTVLSAQFPAFLGAAIASTAVTLFSFATLPSLESNTNKSTTTVGTQQFSKTQQITRVVLAVVVLVAVLLTENFLVWVVSATFEPGYNAATAPPPLQDNGQRILQYLLNRDMTKRQVVSLRRVWNVQWSLVACLGASFVLVEVYFHPVRQLYTLGTRAILSLAAARLVRTMSFLLTVLPSQNVQCYGQHYPNPPPTDWWEWIAVGLVPASHGGCNDLIISGHATVTSTLACVATSVGWEDPLFGLALWSMVALDYGVEIYEGFHYSVDMWLGMVLVCLLWRVLAPIEETNISRSANAERPPQRIQEQITFRIIVMYGFPAILAFLQVAVLPKSMANLLIVIYVIAIVSIYLVFVVGLFEIAKPKPGSLQQDLAVHWGQHTLLCLLYLALGVYL